MSEERTIHEVEQATALLADSLPPLWWRLYRNSIDAGFTSDEAMQLVKTHILSAGIVKL